MSAGARPLSGLRVIDLAGLPGAYGAMLLAGLGADVIKVEPPAGDDLRHLAPFSRDGGARESLWFAAFGQGKRSVVIDCAVAAGRDQLRRLLASADAVIESHPPGALDAMDLGYAATSLANPALLWAAVTPFGQSGPRRDWKGSNLIAWASSGVLYQTGFPDRPPVTPGGPVQLACHVASLNAAAGLLLALRARRVSGRGQLIDVSMQECCLAINPESGVPLSLDDGIHRRRSGNRRNATRPFGLYPAADGHVSLLIVQPAHWRLLAAWIHETTGDEAILEPAFEDLAFRFQAADIVDAATEALTVKFRKLHLFHEAQRRGIPLTPVNTVADIAADPHLAAAGFFETSEHPVLGTYMRPGPAFRTPPGWWSLGPAPLLGQHTGEVLASL
ncbi:MAG: CoA transferase [Chloroflexi bacterium]|nr:CoA transferase [Chloroflexota bacterium]